MVRQGKFNNNGHTALLDIVKAMVELEDRNERGVGKQNFNYGPALIEFAHTCAIISPELYRTLQTHMQLPALRSLKYVDWGPSLVYSTLMTAL